MERLKQDNINKQMYEALQDNLKVLKEIQLNQDNLESFLVSLSNDYLKLVQKVSELEQK